MNFKLQKYFLSIILAGIMSLGFSQTNIGDVEVINTTNFDPVVKDAVKQTDRPEIVDTVKKIKNVTYSSPAKQYSTFYQTSTIEPAKMLNEPLSKLYQSLIKVGMGNYTMPYADIFFNNLRSKDMNWGVRYNHLSSHAVFTNLGTTDFADDNASIYGKKFFRKHTLSGDFNYSRNAVHYYGFQDTGIYKNLNADIYKQIFQTFEGKLRLLSHYGDSSKKINHDIHLNYYNYGDHYNTFENNVYADGLLKANIDKEVFNVLGSVDYYTVHAAHDTLSNAIVRVSPFIQAGGKKWGGDIGITGTLDYFSNTGPKYYFYPRFNVFYNVYENIIIPYAGSNGGLEKNSFRSMSTLNPFVLSNLSYKNTDNKYNFYGGLRGALSSNTSYDVKVLYGQYNNMAFYLVDYNQRPSDNTLGNKYKVVYMNTGFLNVNAQIKYQYKEKMTFLAKGNYYGYTLDTTGVYPWHKPNFDITLSGLYNLKSKFILKADMFFIGNQWALQQVTSNGVTVVHAARLKGIADINLGAEYRYTKMLSFFATFNNIGNFRYYRWDQYPTQRFNAMIGITFVPF
jgi:hypothetical protein